MHKVTHSRCTLPNDQCVYMHWQRACHCFCFDRLGRKKKECFDLKGNMFGVCVWRSCSLLEAYCILSARNKKQKTQFCQSVSLLSASRWGFCLTINSDKWDQVCTEISSEIIFLQRETDEALTKITKCVFCVFEISVVCFHNFCMMWLIQHYWNEKCLCSYIKICIYKVIYVYAYGYKKNFFPFFACRLSTVFIQTPSARLKAMCCCSSSLLSSHAPTCLLSWKPLPVYLLSSSSCSLSLCLPHPSPSSAPLPASTRLRSVKMEQRKLNDQANTLVDLAKVSFQVWILSYFVAFHMRRPSLVGHKLPQIVYLYVICILEKEIGNNFFSIFFRKENMHFRKDAWNRFQASFTITVQF